MCSQSSGSAVRGGFREWVVCWVQRCCLKVSHCAAPALHPHTHTVGVTAAHPVAADCRLYTPSDPLVWVVLTHAVLWMTLLPPTTSSATLVQVFVLLQCRHTRVCSTGTLCWDRLYYRAPLCQALIQSPCRLALVPVRGQCNIACWHDSPPWCGLLRVPLAHMTPFDH